VHVLTALPDQPPGLRVLRPRVQHSSAVVEEPSGDLAMGPAAPLVGLARLGAGVLERPREGDRAVLPAGHQFGVQLARVDPGGGDRLFENVHRPP
jgi:hypothetical protein